MDTPPGFTAAQAAQFKIAALEASQHRPLREFTLTQNLDALKRVQAIDAQIAALRAQLTTEN